MYGTLYQVLEGNGLGDYPEMYIMVPRENLTQGRWMATFDLFRKIPSSKVPDFNPKEPEAPIFRDQEAGDEAEINELTWYFSASYVENDDWPEEGWPVPQGMGLIHAYNFWDKYGPKVDSEDEYLLVGGAIMSGMGGVFANYANEVQYYEVETYNQFLACNYGTVLLSKTLVEDVGLSNLERFGKVTDMGEGVQLECGMADMKGEGELWKVLQSVGYMRPLSQMSRPPKIDWDELGQNLERNYHMGVKMVLVRDEKSKESMKEEGEGWKRKYEEQYGPLPDWIDLRDWAQQKGDMAVAGQDPDAMSHLSEMRDWYRKFRDLRGEMFILRQMVRIFLHKEEVVSYHITQEVERLAWGLKKLGEYYEAAMMYKLLSDHYKTRGTLYRPSAMYNLADALYRAERYIEAEQAMLDWIALEDPNANFRKHGTAIFLMNMVEINLRKNELEEASRLLDRMEPYAAYLQHGWPNVMSRYLGLGTRLEMAKGDLDRAEDLARRGVNFSWASFYTSAEDLADNLDVLADVMESKGDGSGAEEARLEAEELLEFRTKEDYLKEKGIAPDNVKKPVS